MTISVYTVNTLKESNPILNKASKMLKLGVKLNLVFKNIVP